MTPPPGTVQKAHRDPPPPLLVLTVPSLGTRQNCCVQIIGLCGLYVCFILSPISPFHVSSSAAAPLHSRVCGREFLLSRLHMASHACTHGCGSSVFYYMYLPFLHLFSLPLLPSLPSLFFPPSLPLYLPPLPSSLPLPLSSPPSLPPLPLSLPPSPPLCPHSSRKRELSLLYKPERYPTTEQ